ncbi:MAG: hypothetical protein KJ601_04740 [Nanoarchaeota archaeon]|nr:hypothetical protein [Nanoarchaeota archaeon]
MAIAALLLILLAGAITMYNTRSQIYENIMASEFRPILGTDKIEFQKNIKQLRQILSEGCELNHTQIEINQLSNQVNAIKFGLVYDMNEAKKELMQLYIKTNQELKQCYGSPRSNNKLNITLKLDLKNNSAKIDLRNQSLINDFVEIKNIGKNSIEPKIIINQNDYSSMNSIKDTIINGNLSDHEKALNIWEFVVAHRYHYANPVKAYYELSPLNALNDWGYHNCGNAARMIIALAQTANMQAREVRLLGHIVSEVYYDDKWHMFDADGEVIYYLDGQVASVDEISDHLYLIDQTESQIYSNEYLKRAYSKKVTVIYPNLRSETHSYKLGLGESILLKSHNDGYYFASENYSMPPKFSNAYFKYQKYILSDQIVELEYPYPFVCGNIVGSDEIYFSRNGWIWYRIPDNDFTDLLNNGGGRPDTKIYLKFKKPGIYKIMTCVQLSSYSIPILEPNSINSINFVDEFSGENASVSVTFGLIDSS